jgi:hypothetical protein
VYVLRQNCRAAGWRWDSCNTDNCTDNIIDIVENNENVSQITKKAKRTENPLEAIGNYFTNKQRNTSSSDHYFGNYVGQYLAEMTDINKKNRIKIKLMEV